MSNRARWFFAAWGGIGVGLAVLGLAAFLYFARLNTVFGSNPVARCDQLAGAIFNSPHYDTPITVLLGLGWLVIGLFLSVKAVCNPSQFWRHTASHLAITAALAWAIFGVLFVAIAVLS